MGKPLTVEEKLNRPAHQTPFYERVQGWIVRMDIGASEHWFRFVLFCLLVGLVMLVYTGTQFHGLRDREAMDAAQLARNLARGKGYVTQNLRPVDLAYLNAIYQNTPARKPLSQGRNAIPELWMPPVYPALIAPLFSMISPRVDVAEAMKKMDLGPQIPKNFRQLDQLCDVTRRQALSMDRLLVAVGWASFVVGLALVYVFARELFDHRVALTCVFLYLFCDPLLDCAIAGVPHGFMGVLFLLVTYGLYKAEKWQTAKKPPVWVYGALAVSALALGVGILTRYAFAAVLVPMLVYVGVSFRAYEWKPKVALCAGVVLLLLAPWMARNWNVSQTAFGLSWVEFHEGVQLNATTEIAPGQLERSYEVPGFTRVRPLVRKAMINLRGIYENPVRSLGGNYLIVFFLASLLHRFRQDEVFRLRRLVFWSLLGCVLWLSVVGPPSRDFLTIFLPMILIYGTAFFYVMFERLQFRTRLLRFGMVGLFVGANILPFAFTLLPPPPVSPYPPYDSGRVSVLNGAFRPEEVLASDIPWAVSWYADRGTVWLPFGKTDYENLDVYAHVISGVYLTPETLLRQDMLQTYSSFQEFWVKKYRPDIPLDLPLQVRRPMTSDGLQVLISDRER